MPSTCSDWRACSLRLFVVFLVVRAVSHPREVRRTTATTARGALGEAREHGVRFAGRAACLDCHDDVDTATAGGKHAGVGCEACHGPLAAHVADPATVVPEKPDPPSVCLVCHVENLAKPKGFPQIEPKDHCGDDMRHVPPAARAAAGWG